MKFHLGDKVKVNRTKCPTEFRFQGRRTIVEFWPQVPYPYRAGREWYAAHELILVEKKQAVRKKPKR